MAVDITNTISCAPGVSAKPTLIESKANASPPPRIHQLTLGRSLCTRVIESAAFLVWPDLMRSRIAFLWSSDALRTPRIEDRGMSKPI